MPIVTAIAIVLDSHRHGANNDELIWPFSFVVNVGPGRLPRLPAEPAIFINQGFFMSKKQIAISAYFAIAALFAIYGTFWGDHAYRGFAYNLGGALFWPTILFPALGKAIGGVVIVVGVIAILVFVKRRP